LMSSSLHLVETSTTVGSVKSFTAFRQRRSIVIRESKLAYRNQPSRHHPFARLP
jgi:hypothetical protein